MDKYKILLFLLIGCQCGIAMPPPKGPLGDRRKVVKKSSNTSSSSSSSSTLISKKRSKKSLPSFEIWNNQVSIEKRIGLIYGEQSYLKTGSGYYEGGQPKKDYGYKFHISLPYDANDAEHLLTKRAQYTLLQFIVEQDYKAHKFLPIDNYDISRLNNNGEPYQQGKFIALYPENEIELISISQELKHFMEFSPEFQEFRELNDGRAYIPHPTVNNEIQPHSGFPIYIRYGVLTSKVSDKYEVPIEFNDEIESLLRSKPELKDAYITKEGSKYLLNDKYARKNGPAYPVFEEKYFNARLLPQLKESLSSNRDATDWIQAELQALREMEDHINDIFSKKATSFNEADYKIVELYNTYNQSDNWENLSSEQLKHLFTMKQINLDIKEDKSRKKNEVLKKIWKQGEEVFKYIRDIRPSPNENRADSKNERKNEEAEVREELLKIYGKEANQVTTQDVEVLEKYKRSETTYEDLNKMSDRNLNAMREMAVQNTGSSSSTAYTRYRTVWEDFSRSELARNNKQERRRDERHEDRREEKRDRVIRKEKR